MFLQKNKEGFFLKNTVLNIDLVKGYKGLLYLPPFYCLTNKRADSRLHFNYTLKVKPIYYLKNTSTAL